METSLPRARKLDKRGVSGERALVISGRLQNASEVIHVMAEEIADRPTRELPEQASRNHH